jgi:hypothetical protein
VHAAEELKLTVSLVHTRLLTANDPSSIVAWDETVGDGDSVFVGDSDSEPS